MSMGVGLTVVIALFIDAGTVTADFNRWAATPTASLVSTFSAFPFANLVAMLVGGVMTAALAVPNANPFGADNMFGYMNGKQMVWLSVFAFHLPLRQSRFGLLALPVQCGNGLVAHLGHPYAHHGDRSWACIGIVVAAGNVWAFFIQWLSLLGILVPPIGAIILVDQYLLRPNASISADWRPLPFIAWAIGSLCAFSSSIWFPGLSTAISAAVVAGIVYYGLAIAGGADEKAPRIA